MLKYGAEKFNTWNSLITYCLFTCLSVCLKSISLSDRSVCLYVYKSLRDPHFSFTQQDNKL